MPRLLGLLKIDKFRVLRSILSFKMAHKKYKYNWNITHGLYNQLSDENKDNSSMNSIDIGVDINPDISLVRVYVYRSGYW